MTAILADVGGTNTRVARGAGGLLDPGSLRWFRNDDFSDFASVLGAYGIAGAHKMCVAIAGPVTGRQARLTNRDWVIDADAWDMPVTLCNDLQAVGHALGLLPEDAFQTVRDGTPAPGAQRLVVGLGTGFNVSIAGRHDVLRAEAGHATLPSAVADWVTERTGKMPFHSVEHLFSGTGLRALFQLKTGRDLPTDRIVSSAPGTLSLFAEAFGILVTQLVYQYLPTGGIVLNGGLARALMGTEPGREGFKRGFVMRDEIGQRLGDIPVYVVTDDAAALYGCARLAAR